MSLQLSLALWRDISVIWLALLCFIGLAVPLGAAYFAVRAMDAALNKTASGLGKVQGYSRMARTGSADWSARIAAPVIRTKGRWAGWQGVLHALRPSRPNK